MPGLDPRVVASGFAKNQEKYAASKQGGVAVMVKIYVKYFLIKEESQ